MSFIRLKFVPSNLCMLSTQLIIVSICMVLLTISGCSIKRLFEADEYQNQMIRFLSLVGQVNRDNQRAQDSLGRAERAVQRATGESVNTAEMCFSETQEHARAADFWARTVNSIHSVAKEERSLKKARDFYDAAEGFASGVKVSADLAVENADCAQQASTGLAPEE